MYIDTKSIVLKEGDGRIRFELVMDNRILRNLIEETFYTFINETEENSNNALKNIELLQKYYDLKDIIVECIDRFLYSIINDFGYEVDKIESRIEKLEMLTKMSLEEMIRNFKVRDLANYIKFCNRYKGKYSDVFVDKLNKEIIDEVLIEMEAVWDNFKIGRGEVFYYIIYILVNLCEMKDKLTEENINKIQKFLLSHNIEHIINRRIKKDEHLNYIKAILSFLPDEIKGKYVAYFL
jgi:hypothetical protein